MFTAERFESLPKFADIRFKYVYDFTLDAWLVIEEGGTVAVLSATQENTFKESSGIIQLDMDILSDFDKFKKRPEYSLVSIKVPEKNSITIEALQEMYELAFVGSVLVRAVNHNVGCNPDDAWPQIDKALKWIRSTDFFKAPASSVYHDSYEGGLCYHSLKVAQNIIDLMHCEKFNNSAKLGDAILCALVHDWCKIDMYESYIKNVKNDATGVWDHVSAFRYKGSAVINLGHGVSSMFLASKFFRLNLEEASAIRWHMGAYRTSDAEFDELQTCNEQFPLVHLLQFADQLSLVKF